MNQQVAEAFKKLYFGKRTGVLTCEADSAQRAVYFQTGFVVAASSSLDEDRLGEVMIRHGRITQQQFEDASHFIKSGWKLGEILAELSIIDEEEIDAFVRLQLLDIACTQLIRPPRRLSFAPLSGVDALLEAPLSVADILMEAARRTPKLGPKIEALKNEDRKIGFPSDSLKRFQDVSLQPEEAFVLSRVDGTQAARDIFAVSPLSEEQTARTLVGLLEAELIELEGTDVVEPKAAQIEKSEPGDAVDTSQTLRQEGQRDRARASVERLYQEIQFQDHWQVLGVDRGASSDAVKEAFFRGAKKYHPDKFRRITEPEFQEKLSFIFRRINEAYETLSSPEARGRYESLRAKEEQYAQSVRESATPAAAHSRAKPDDAATLFRRAQLAFETEDFWTSIELARQAVDLAPDCAAYYHLLGVALAKNPKWRQDAEKNLKIAANLDPFKASYVLELAKLYENAGLHLRAQKTLEKAQAIDPTVEGPD
jgi:tetratricopeptide (TPR) repeat protein